MSTPSAIATLPLEYQSFERELERIAAHRCSFEHLVAGVERYVSLRNYSAAAALAQLAADFAWHNHTGFFVSPQLESVLAQIGQLKVSGSELQPIKPLGTERVLHVLTQAYGLGGHTRLVWRWIQHDYCREHTVALTRQELVVPPPQLAEAVASRNGQLIIIDRKPGDLIQRARRLRKLASSYDYVVLHVHPFDVVPLLAFADSDGIPPIILLNHADHVFWLGCSIVNFVANIRASGAALAVQARGISPEQISILPIPLDQVARGRSRAEARRTLGLPEDAMVLLTVASSYKYTPLAGAGSHLAEVVAPVLRSHPQALLIAVGPEATSSHWAAAVQRVDLANQIRAVGRQRDLTAFYEAADIYLDSFPFASLTSMLEAVSYGTPPMSLAPYREEASVLYSDSPGLDDVLYVASNAEAYRAQIARLLADPALRLSLGSYARQSVYAAHSGSAWLQTLETTYASARSVKRVGQHLLEALPIPDCTILNVLLSNLHSRSVMAQTEDDLWRAHIRQLPIRERALAYARLSRLSTMLPLGLLLPEWLGNRLEYALRRGAHV